MAVRRARGREKAERSDGAVAPYSSRTTSHERHATSRVIIMPSRIRLALALIGTLPALALGTPAKAPATLGIKLFAFDPKTITVAAGQTIAVTNGDAIEHTVTFGAPEQKDTRASGATLAANGAATITAPKTPGTYAFYCERHPFMTGTL